MAKDTALSSAFEKWPIGEFEENYGRDEIINPIEFGNVSLLDIADPEIEIQIETQKNGSLKKNRKETAPNEDIRLLQSYIKEVGQERLFTPKKEIETAAKIKSCEARVRVIKANLRLVLIFTKRYLGRGLPLTHLIQEGNIGLMKAVDRFDHTRGFKFSTYASWWINQGMSRAILEQTGSIKVPVYVLEQATKVHKASSMLSNENERKPLPVEISKKSGISLKSVKRVLESTKYAASLDAPIISDAETTLKEFIPDEHSFIADSVVAKTNLSVRIKEALSTLNPREEQIVRMRFGIGYEAEHTLDQVGKQFNLTRERIRQIERRALEKIEESEIGILLKSFLE